MTVTVFNLDTGEYGPTFVGLTPEQAVVSAHAQSLGDFNTWSYERAWGHLVRRGGHTVTCGSFTAMAT